MAVASRLEEPPPALTGVSIFREELQRIGRGRLLVVHATVAELSASMREVPVSVWPEPGRHIVTAASLAVQDTICGTYGEQDIVVHYIGGTIPGVGSSHNSSMPSDLSVGKEYAFALEEIGGEYFLTNGRDGMLSVPESGLFAASDRALISRPDLVRECQ